MSIDWFTFIAQLINFFILVLLMKKFLYKPILKTIDDREKRVSQQLQEAERLKSEANLERDTLQKENREFEQQRQNLLGKAVLEAESERERLLDQARQEIDKLRSDLQETLLNEQRNLSAEIIHRTRKEIFAIVRRTLSDLASVNLEEHIAEVFIEKLKALEEKEKELVFSAVTRGKGEIIIRSTYRISSDKQKAIQDILSKEFNLKYMLQFITVPDQVSGIELAADGYKLVWSIDEYLNALENSIAEILPGNT